MANYFSKEPIINWTKRLCPLCGEPTGRKSDCHNMPPAEQIPIYKRNMGDQKLGVFPVFSEHCIFRQTNLWDAEINYPLSHPLFERIKDVDGINKIEPTTPHGFQIAIAQSFNELEVMDKINNTFYDFIKKLNRIEKEKDVSINENSIGIVMPNGIVFEIDENLSNEEKIKQINSIKEINSYVLGCSVYNKRKGE